ncbi:acetyl-CoA carboxylase biotin carboxyl carrier protein [Rickettsiales bacterium LUAb2]
MKKEDYLSFIQDLAKIINKNNLSEIEFKEEGLTIKLERKAENTVVREVVSSAAHSGYAASSVPAQHINNTVSQQGNVTEESNSAVIDYSKAEGAVKAPMVGVIYCAAAPEQPNFISVGTKVKTGDTLFLIEAMKVYNPIKATKDGTVKKILVENKQVVEYDEPLVIIE